jgi:hypothetical protein
VPPEAVFSVNSQASDIYDVVGKSGENYDKYENRTMVVGMIHVRKN